MPTLAANTITIATSEPAFEPWMVDNDPTSGNGFESAVAYAVAARLGYLPGQVTWTRVGFDEAIAKPDGFDFDINQFTITEDRRKQVDFSSGYYTVAQTVITVDGSPISGATALADLKDAQLGAMNGTTSLDAINGVIAPSKVPQVFDDNALAAQALQNGQIDGLVVDLPTAFYMTGAQLTDGKVIGQLKTASGEAEQLGLLLAKDSPLTSCVTAAVDSLRTDGTLDGLAEKWLAGAGTAPVLS
jgi:polar amino acid transport system substrate-binding protein